ncbi:hypothetical protein COOONC_03646 [Cooperia oncophora]
MFGFLAFNGGSMADIVKPGEGRIVALAMVYPVLKGSLLLGMVSSCAGCNRMEPWASSFTGIGAGLTYLALSHFMIAYDLSVINFYVQREC